MTLLLRPLHLFLPAVAALLLLTAACDRRDLTYGYDNRCDVTFLVDWSRLSEPPQGMTLLFYPTDGGQPLRYLTNSVDSVTLAVPAGTYRVLVFNRTENEFSSLGFRGMDRFETAEVYGLPAPEDMLLWAKRDDSRAITARLEEIAVATLDELTLTEEMRHDYGELSPQPVRRTGTPQTLRLTPASASYTTTIDIHVKGIQNVRSVRATLDGLAEGYLMGAGRATANIVTHAIDEWQVVRDPGSYTEGSLHTRFVCFGLPEASPPRALADELATLLNASLQVTVLLADNQTTVTFSYDVSKRVTVDQTEYVLTIVVGIPLPGQEDDPGAVPPELPDVPHVESPSSGFDATVNDWEEGEEKDLTF